MSDLTGSLKDFRPQAIGSTAEVIFTPTGPATSTSKSLLVPKEIRVSPAADGSFSVSLASYAGTNPSTPYRMRVEWTPAGMAFPIVEEIPWVIVVTGDGQLTDMFAIEEAGKFTVKGDKGDDGDSVMQAAFDALEARMPKPGASDRLRVIDLAGKLALGVTEAGDVNAAGATFRASEGVRFMDLAGYVAAEVTPAGRTLIYDCNLVSGGSSEVNTLHVFPMGGQSNGAGRAETNADLDPKNARIFQYGANRKVLEPATVPLDMHDALTAPVQGLSPATTFARNYLKTQPPNVGVLIVPAAHGGTGFTSSTTVETWTPNTATNPDFDLPARALEQTLAAIEAARAAGYAVTLGGILWHQGEANSSLSTSTYSTRLDELIGYFRSGLGNAQLPFIVGQMAPEGTDLSVGRQGIDMAHSGTPARVAHTGFAPATRGGHNEGDTTHFSRIGVDFLGKTFLAGYWQALGNVLTAAPSAPVNVSATKTGTTVTAQWFAPPANLTKTETFDLATGSLAYNWTAPQSHVTGYRVETKTGAGAWTAVTRAWDMAITETITVTAGTTQVRVTALNGATESAPVTVTAVGA